MKKIFAYITLCAIEDKIYLSIDKNVFYYYNKIWKIMLY